jgi:hypothetical protein
MPDLNNPRMVEARKRKFEERFFNKDYKYHHTGDAEKKRKKGGFYEDDRKRVA